MMPITFIKPGPRYFVWTSRFGNEALCAFKDFCVTPPETREGAVELLDRWTKSAWQNGRCDTYVILERDSWTPPAVFVEPERPRNIPSVIGEDEAKAFYDVQKTLELWKYPKTKS